MNKATLLVASLFVVPLAFGQQGAPPPPPPPPPAPPPSGSAPPPGSEATAVAPAGIESGPSAEELANRGRVRWGVNYHGGVFFMPGNSPVMLVNFAGGEGRVGWSFNRMFAVYGVVGGFGGMFVGGSASSSGGGFSLTVGGGGYFGANGELNLGDIFFVAAGVAVGNLSIAGLSQQVTVNGMPDANQTALGLSGWGFSPDIKIGFGFGKRTESGRRGGFCLAIDFRMYMGSYQTVRVNQSTGGQTAGVHQQFGFGMTPMLMLGYDSR